METNTETLNIEQITPDTVVVTFDGVLAHTPTCPIAQAEMIKVLTEGADPATILVPWGDTGFFPAGCCVDVDVIPWGQNDEHITEFLSSNGRGTRIPKKDLEDVDPATEPEVIAAIEALHGKFTQADATPAMIQFAQNWLADYTGDFEFLLDVRSKTAKSGMSAGQAKGVLNCIRASYFRGEFGPQKETEDETDDHTGMDLTTIPSGRYAVPGGDTRLKIKVDNLNEGFFPPRHRPSKWDGWVFVKDAAEYGHGQKYGAQKPGSLYKGDITEELAIIAADPKAAAIAYGKLVGHCGVCNRVLEDKESIERGIGPVCFAKF